MFSIKGDGTFNARTNNGASQTETQLSSSLIGSSAPLPDRVGRDRGQVLRRRKPGRHPRGRFRHHRDATVGERPEQRRPRRLRRLAAPEPLSGLGHVRLASPRRGPAGQLGCPLAGPPTRRAARASRSACAPATRRRPTGAGAPSTRSPPPGDRSAAPPATSNTAPQLSSSDPDTTPALSEVSASYASDTTPPDTEITDGPSGTTNDPTPTFSFFFLGGGLDLLLPGRLGHLRALYLAEDPGAPRGWLAHLLRAGQGRGRKR